MNPESSSKSSETPEPAESCKSLTPCVHLPLTILGLAFMFFLLLQNGSIDQSAESMRFQSATLEKRAKDVKEGREKLEKAIADRKPLVDQSEQTQKLFTTVMTDLIEISKDDADAKQIVDGYGIRISPPAEAPAAASGDEKKDAPKDEKKPGDK